jgi:pimeloyl-ACP methyl ester carboxylesterase
MLITRATRSWGRLLLLPWALAVLVGVYALSIALAAVLPPHPPAGESPDGSTSVAMVSIDGVELSGWYLPSRNGAAVVVRHGARSDASTTIAQARILHDAGFGVLATDARGHGSSEGQGMDLGWFGDADTRAAIDYLAQRDDVDPSRIGVVGLSMGGEEAIGAAAADPRICAVVAEGATGRTAADKRWLANEYGFAGVVQNGLDAVTYALIGMLTTAEPPPTLAESIERAEDASFLLVAAGAVADERLVAERLSAIAPDRVAVWVAADAEHVGAAHSSPREWEERVAGFLDSALVGCAH